jgi:hypothetical protein
MSSHEGKNIKIRLNTVNCVIYTLQVVYNLYVFRWILRNSDKIHGQCEMPDSYNYVGYLGTRKSIHEDVTR